MRHTAAVLLSIVLLIGQALALEPEEKLEDPALEDRARALSATLRCVVCQNQSIDESNAGIAGDMRRLVRQRLVAGDSDAEVRQYLVDRYGDYVLLRPPVSRQTLILWGAPAALIVLGMLTLLIVARGRSRTTAAAPLSDDERKRLAKLLAGKPSADGD